jgi:predicted transglutaminase-like protease
MQSATGKISRIAAEFQVCDDSGNIEVVQRADGKVYVPDQQYPIGRIHQPSFKQAPMKQCLGRIV